MNTILVQRLSRVRFRQWIAFLHLLFALSLIVTQKQGTVAWLATQGIGVDWLVIPLAFAGILMLFPVPILFPLLPLLLFGVVGAVRSMSIGASGPVVLFYIPGLVNLIMWLDRGGKIGRVPVYAVVSLNMALLGIGILLNPTIGQAARVGELYGTSSEIFGLLLIFGAYLLAAWPSSKVMNYAMIPMCLWVFGVLSFSLRRIETSLPAVIIGLIFTVCLINLYRREWSFTWTSTS